MIKLRQLFEGKYIPYLFHGTSDKFIPSIKQHGLKNSYVATDPYTAKDEAEWTVHGDNELTKNMSSNHKKPQGGTSHILVIDRNHSSIKKGLKIDPEYKEPHSNPYAFKHLGIISPEAIIDSIPVNKFKNSFKYWYASKQFKRKK